MFKWAKRLRSGGMIALVLACMVMLFCVLPMIACDDSDKDKNRDAEEEAQQANLTASIASYPPYQYNNFLTRQAVNEYCERTDTPGKLWYVYLYAPMGQELGMFVADRIPTSINIAMTNPYDIYRSSNGNVAIKAPALDGVYYAGNIDMAYIFDVESDAMICYYNLPAIVSDKPLSLNMPEINVVFEPEKATSE